jgi:uncharacterized protein (DUF2141 family)
MLLIFQQRIFLLLIISNKQSVKSAANQSLHILTMDFSLLINQQRNILLLVFLINIGFFIVDL